MSINGNFDPSIPLVRLLIRRLNRALLTIGHPLTGAEERQRALSVARSCASALSTTVVADNTRPTSTTTTASCGAFAPTHMVETLKQVTHDD